MIIRLDNKFYEKEAVEEALKDFSEVLEGKIVNDSIDVKIELKEHTGNIKEEFCNYVLGLMRNKGLA